MSLKIKTAARLKVLFPGVALSKKSVEALGDQFAKAGLTDESTDEEIDAKINDRNALYSFEDQKKFDDYQTGKASKDAKDKADAEAKALLEGKTPPVNPDETPTEKMLREALAGIQALTGEIASIKGEKVTNDRSAQLAKILENTPEAFKNKAIKDFKRMKFENEEEFNDYLTETETDAADFIQEQSNLGLTGQTPAAGFGKAGQAKEASKEEVDNVLDKIM